MNAVAVDKKPNIGVFDYPIMNFNDTMSPWKSLFFGLLSPHANKYKSLLT